MRASTALERESAATRSTSGQKVSAGTFFFFFYFTPFFLFVPFEKRNTRKRGVTLARGPSSEQRRGRPGSFDVGALLFEELTPRLSFFTVPGALQGILGPEGKPVPGFVRGTPPILLPLLLPLPVSECVCFPCVGV